MTAIFNIKTKAALIGRLYFALDPQGYNFYATYYLSNGEYQTIHSTSLENIQHNVREVLNNKFGMNNYVLISSEPAEREKYENQFIQFINNL